MEDGRIIELYWQRSDEAISETDKKYGRYCRTISRNILNDNEDAQECVNDTYLAAWNSMPPERPGKLAAFLGKLTRSISLDRYRERNAKKRGGGETVLALSELEDCIPDYKSGERMSESLEITEALEKFLCAQQGDKRDIFICRYWYMYSVKEISGKFGMTERKIVNLLYRMRKELRGHLEKEGIVL